MKSIALVACLLLAGCNTKVIREPVEVQVMVPVPCLQAAVAKPSWILDNPDVAKKNVFDKMLAVLQELEQRRAYEAELEAAMQACTTKTM